MASTAAAGAPVRATASRSPKKLIGLLFFALLTIFVTYGKNHEILNPQSDIAKHFAPVMNSLAPHAFFGAIALFAGLLQFSTRLRNAYPAFHRGLGYTYAVSTLISAPLGIAVAAKTFPSLIAASVIQSAGWLGFTVLAILCIRNGNMAEHRRWMIRGYAYAAVFTVARTIIPLPFVFKYGPQAVEVTVYTTIALAGIVPTLFLDWPKFRKRTA